jgi:hypothetical protein
MQKCFLNDFYEELSITTEKICKVYKKYHIWAMDVPQCWSAFLE